MKRIISLVMALLLICSMYVVIADTVAVTIDAVVYPNKQSYYKTEEDVVRITGRCSSGRDIVIRVYDENESMIYTDIILANNNIDGRYEFTNFVLPASGSKKQLTYKVVVSVPAKGTDAADIAESEILVNASESSISSNGGSSEKTSFVNSWDDDEDKEQAPTESTEEKTEPAPHDPLNEKVIQAAAKQTTASGGANFITATTKATDVEAMAWESTRNTIAVSVETMMANISSKRINAGFSTNTLVLRESSISDSDLKKYTNTEKTLNEAIVKNEITLNRELSKEYVVNTSFSASKIAKITIYKGFVTKLESVGIETLAINDNDFRVSYSLTELNQMIGDKEFTSFDIDTTTMSSSTKKLTVNFKTDQTQSVKISFPGLDGDTKYMAIVDEEGNPIGGRYNPATGALEAKISESGVYQIVNNEKDFEDIKNKSEEMQESIKILAAKGIIQGTSETTFSPDSPITRAEIAALLLRVLSQVDPNADGGFEDVKQTDWFYGTAGSARKYGMIKGFEDNTFRGNNVIEKDQILTIASRVLQKEMRYKAPTNVDEWLKFTDADKIADWAKNDIALATMANIITRSEDNTIKSSEPMTRGDAALIIMRLFYKIW